MVMRSVDRVADTWRSAVASDPRWPPSEPRADADPPAGDPGCAILRLLAEVGGVRLNYFVRVTSSGRICCAARRGGFRLG